MTDEYTSWLASQARPWAEQVRKRKGNAECMRAMADERISALDGMKGIDYSKPGGGASPEHGDDATFALVQSMLYAMAAYMDAERSYMDEVEAFANCCTQLDGTYADLLRYRYALNMQWADVARRMGYDEVYARGELNMKALAALYHVMPHYLRDPIPRAD